MINRDAIANIIKMYMEEDFDYVVKMASIGKKVEGPENTDELANWLINRREVNKEDATEVARVCFAVTKAIEDEIYKIVNERV